MLVVTPTPLGTDAERHLLEVLSGMRAGNAALGGLAVFIPVVDGALQRRQADALIFLPETIIVARITGTGRQSGDLVPAEDRAWTIGGEPLRLPGGGSTPVPGLLKAVQMIGGQLRDGGLDPGCVSALTVLDGAVGAVAALDAGPMISRMSPQEVTRALRRCATRGGAGDTRVWTTADVKAALDVLGVYARIPSVEELNNEGFMYSPYVLRRTEPSMAHGPFLPPLAFAPAGVQPRLAPPPREVEPEPGTSGPQRRGGFAEMFDTDTDERVVARPESRRSSLARRLAIMVAIAVAVPILIVVAFLVLRTGDSGQGGALPPSSLSGTLPAAGSVVGSVQQIDGTSYTLAAAQSDGDCAANSYGGVGAFFVERPCTGLQRALFTTTVDGRAAVVSVSVVSMPDPDSAAALRELADTNGTGNVSDLLAAGVSIPGAPAELSGGSYDSAAAGQVVRIVLVNWSHPDDPGSPSALDVTAHAALSLQLPAGG